MKLFREFLAEGGEGSGKKGHHPERDRFSSHHKDYGKGELAHKGYYHVDSSASNKRHYFQNEKGHVHVFTGDTYNGYKHEKYDGKHDKHTNYEHSKSYQQKEPTKYNRTDDAPKKEDE